MPNFDGALELFDSCNQRVEFFIGKEEWEKAPPLRLMGATSYTVSEAEHIIKQQPWAS